LKEKISNWIKNYVKNFKISTQTFTEWDDPLIGFADANDPLFLKLKTVIGKTHKHPLELLTNAHTVVVYFIPFKEEMVKTNEKGRISSKEWAISYIETNNLILQLNDVIEENLRFLGFKAVKMPSTHNFSRKKLISDWSHKHVAYIAGLGNFGLHQMLITDKGCCGRLGSIITSAKIESTERSANQYCLYYYDRSCSKCVDYCKFNALKLDTFDKYRCYEVCLENAKIYPEFGFADVCGKCISIVPCSFKNPVNSKL
jgi:epoxyqueuosine reductase QueG